MSKGVTVTMLEMCQSMCSTGRRTLCCRPDLFKDIKLDGSKKLHHARPQAALPHKHTRPCCEQASKQAHVQIMVVTICGMWQAMVAFAAIMLSTTLFGMQVHLHLGNPAVASPAAATLAHTATNSHEGLYGVRKDHKTGS